MIRGDAAGLVSLVGAGPGDPGLLTLLGQERLRRADLVVYDRLINPVLLQEVRPEAERVFVGKEAGAQAMPQAEIARALIDGARAGKAVVRLKGGDPFVFGRGGEEAEALAAAGVPFEVVPGVGSAVAAPAYAGIPVTHREIASSFVVVTGHEDASKTGSAIDWEAIARGPDTIACLMARRTLAAVCERLIAHGRPPDTPAALVERGTTPQQRVVEAPLARLPAAADAAGLAAPAVLIVGQVVSLRAKLRWFDQRPLFGKRVLITRTRTQVSEMARCLVREGAEPIEFPAIEIEARPSAATAAAVADLAAGRYDWTILTSTNGVDQLFDALDRAGHDSRALGGVRVAAIGQATAGALARRGIRADVVPARYVAEELLLALADHRLEGARVLLARADGARTVLPQGLRGRGATVDDVVFYVSRRPATADSAVIARLEAGEIDIATFTASSTVQGCVELLNGRTELLERPFVACIGPVTAATARELGLRVDVVSEEHTIPGLVHALKDAFGKVMSHA